jgi:hypothetical protein
MSDAPLRIDTEAGQAAANLGAPHQIRFVAAFASSWALWIGAWLMGRAVGVEEMLFNEEAVALDHVPISHARPIRSQRDLRVGLLCVHSRSHGSDHAARD